MVVVVVVVVVVMMTDWWAKGEADRREAETLGNVFLEQGWVRGRD